MRSLVFLLAGAFIVLCAKTAVKDAIYQIQGVEVDDAIEFEIDGSKHAAYARRKRQAVVETAPIRNKSDSAGAKRQAGYGQTNQLAYDLTAAAAAKVPSRQRPAHRPLQAVRPGKKGTHYYYPPRQPLPLPKCFHNPTGYVCCNEALNDLMVDTYTALEQRPKFHACNIQLIATHLQLNAQRHFNTSFETLVGYEDFAQKINFRGDMVCKVELGSRYMIAYATASDAYNHDLGGQRRDKREANEEFEWSAGTADSWHSIHSSFI